MATLAATLRDIKEINMKINREFTNVNQSPYEKINFKKVSTEILNPDGSPVFKLENFEVPENWSQVASDILSQKYFNSSKMQKP